MDGVPRRPTVSVQRQQSIDSTGRALSPTDSVISISSHVPLLTWMFEHIRREDQDSLTKEDLRRLLEVDIDNEQLDEAFENLDMDGDGRVSLDEFLGGFARFLREAPMTPGPDRHLNFALLRANGGHGEPAHSEQQRPRPGGKKRGSVRRRLVDKEECYESTDKGADMEVNGGPAVKPSENFSQCLVTLSSHNRHSIVSLWQGLHQTNPELLGDFEGFVGEIAHEVEVAQRALEIQRRATKQEALELDEEMESRLNAANANLQIQTALTELKTKLKLEQRLGDKEKELSAVKQKLQELNSRLESVCNFALQLENEVQEGHKAHTELEEQFEMLSQEKQHLQSQLDAREVVLIKKHKEMEHLHRQASHMQSSNIDETQVELQEMKREYEREISELREKIMTYESQSVTSDDDLSLLSGQTPDLLSTMSSRHRHTSRHSLLDEIVKQEGIESPILRGEPLMANTDEEMARPARRTNSLPNLFRTRLHLEPVMQFPINFQASPHSHKQWSSHTHSRQESPLSHESTPPPDEMTPSEPPITQEHLAKQADHMTKAEGQVTSQKLHLDSPFSRLRSATVSGGGRPRLRARRAKKMASGHIQLDSDQTHVMLHDSHLTASNDNIPSGENRATAMAAAVPSLVVSKNIPSGESHVSAVAAAIPSLVVSKNIPSGESHVSAVAAAVPRLVVSKSGESHVSSMAAAVPSLVVSKNIPSGESHASAVAAAVPSLLKNIPSGESHVSAVAAAVPSLVVSKNIPSSESHVVAAVPSLLKNIPSGESHATAVAAAIPSLVVSKNIPSGESHATAVAAAVPSLLVSKNIPSGESHAAAVPSLVVSKNIPSGESHATAVAAAIPSLVVSKNIPSGGSHVVAAVPSRVVAKNIPSGKSHVTTVAAAVPSLVVSKDKGGEKVEHPSDDQYIMKCQV